MIDLVENLDVLVYCLVGLLIDLLIGWLDDWRIDWANNWCEYLIDYAFWLCPSPSRLCGALRVTLTCVSLNRSPRTWGSATRLWRCRERPSRASRLTRQDNPSHSIFWFVVLEYAVCVVCAVCALCNTHHCFSPHVHSVCACVLLAFNLVVHLKALQLVSCSMPWDSLLLLRGLVFLCNPQSTIQVLQPSVRFCL